jgi:hypothetical protein
MKERCNACGQARVAGKSDVMLWKAVDGEHVEYPKLHRECVGNWICADGSLVTISFHSFLAGSRSPDNSLLPAR